MNQLQTILIAAFTGALTFGGMSSASAAVFSDDFESYAVGTNPGSPNWNQRFGVPVSDSGTPFGSPTKYVTIPGNSRFLFSSDMFPGSVPTLTTLSFDFIDNTTGAGGADDGLGLGWISSTANDFNADTKIALGVKLRQGSFVKWTQADTNVASGAGTYAMGVVNHIDVVFNSDDSATVTDYFGSRDLSPDQADIFINGEYVATLNSFDQSAAVVPERIAFRTFSADESVDFLIDSVQVVEGVAVPEPTSLAMLLVGGCFLSRRKSRHA